jgi:integrase
VALGSDETQVRRKYDALIAAPKAERGTVDQMLEEAIEAMRDTIAPNTLHNYNIYRRHLAAVFDRPEDITQADVLRYLRKCPRMTFRGEVGLLSQGFVLWMEERGLTFNPCFGVKIKRPGSRRRRLLSDAEMDAIVSKADERLAVAIELAYATGLRISDLCRMRWDHVLTRKTGVRQEYENTDDLAALIARARALQARVGSLYVLCLRGGRKWDVRYLREKWHEARKAAGVAHAIFHDIRAAAATEVDRQGGNAQLFLGHKDAKTTMIYLRGLKINIVRPLARRKA